jgi:hypothetical protein
MADLFGYKKPRDPITPGVKVRRAVWKAIRAMGSAQCEVPAGPIAAALKMSTREVIRLWATEGYRLSYAILPDGTTLEYVRDIEAALAKLDDPGSVLLGVDGD